VKRILVTGAGGSAGIGFTRCLKAAQEKMFLVGTDSSNLLIHFSETNRKILILPASSPEYIEVLNGIIEEFKVEFVHAQPDIEIAAISRNREKIQANVFLPDKETIEICHDKFKSNEIWRGKGIPAAKTILITDEKVLKMAFDKVDSPLWVRANRGAGGKGSLLVEKCEHAKAWIDYWTGWGNFLASEYLPGANFGWDGLFKDGELVCSQTKQRLEYVLQGASPSGVTGTTGVAKSIKREDIDEIAKKAIYAIDQTPNGAFSVDLKENVNKIPCVTEINPGRFLSSSLHFFHQAKCLLPYLYVKLAYGEKISSADIPRQISPGTILIRGLDKSPILLDEEKLGRLSHEKERARFVIT